VVKTSIMLVENLGGEVCAQKKRAGLNSAGALFRFEVEGYSAA